MLSISEVLLPPPWPVCNDGLCRAAEGQGSIALLNINHADFSHKIWGHWILIHVLTHTVYLSAQQNYHQPSSDFSFIMITLWRLQGDREPTAGDFPCPMIFHITPQCFKHMIKVHPKKSQSRLYVSTPTNACCNRYQNAFLFSFLFLCQGFPSFIIIFYQLSFSVVHFDLRYIFL